MYAEEELSLFETLPLFIRELEIRSYSLKISNL